ncbi:unnamed protein product [Schistosoma spindalis]|nr:unnamed protein product [Schistosoma spindale]
MSEVFNEYCAVYLIHKGCSGLNYLLLVSRPCKEQSSILMDFYQKSIFHKLKSSGWDYIKWYADSAKLVPGCTIPLILAAQQCSSMDVIKLKVAVVLMIPLIEFSKKTFDLLSLHSMIETVEQNRDGFLKEVFHEYRSFTNFDIYDSKTTSFSVKLVEISGLVRVV